MCQACQKSSTLKRERNARASTIQKSNPISSHVGNPLFASHAFPISKANSIVSTTSVQDDVEDLYGSNFGYLDVEPDSIVSSTGNDGASTSEGVDDLYEEVDPDSIVSSTGNDGASTSEDVDDLYGYNFGHDEVVNSDM